MDTRSSKNQTTILHRLAEVGQGHVAVKLGVDDSTISRLKERLPQFSHMLSILGLKIVPTELKCYRSDYVDSLEQIAEEHFRMKRELHIKPPLEWEDE